MSICSDVFITKEKAQKLVRSKLLEQQESLIEAVIASNQNSATKEELLAQQTLLVDQAISGMSNWDLTGILNSGDNDLYFYNITEPDGEDEE